jgi:homeobox protein cut-like
MSAQSSLNQRSLASQMAHHHHQQQQQQQQHHHHQQQQQQQQLHQSPVLVKIDKNSSSSVSKSLSNTPLGGHNNNATSNGLTPSPMDDSSTPTPGLTGSGIPTLAAYSLPAHSVYELAALTQDLDTQGMTTKIKEVLLANNIGQKIFGEAVLGLSQGSVSELLSKPKPWHMLSIKGREPFIRMQLWLSDPRNIEHIQRLKTERREAGKRRRDLGFPMGATDAAGPNSNASSNTNSFMGGDNSSNDGSMGGSPSPYGGNPNHHHHHQATSLTTTGAGASLSSSSPSPAKKQRILFSDQQKEALKLAFSLDPYPSTSAMEFLAQELNLSTRTITNCFHNHRMRLKQQQSNSLDCSTKEEISSSASPATMANGGRESSGQFDPIHFRLLFHQRLFEMQVASGEEGSGGHHHNPASGGGGGGGHHPGAGAGGMALPASLAGLPPQLAGNLNMMASLGMPYPFYATGMLSQFCMGLGNPSPDMAPGAEGLDLTLARQRVAALVQSDSDAEDSDCESDTSSRTGPTPHRDLDRRRGDSRPPVKMPSPLMSMIAQAKTAASLGIASQEGPASQAAARSSRRSRKPAAPQWVNPHWQQTSAVRERVESEDGRDSSEERDKKKAKHFSSLHHRSVDANLNNFVESDAPAAGGRDSSAERPSVRATVDDDDDDKYDNDEEEDDDEEESPKRLTIHRPRAGSLSPSRRASPSPSPSSDEDKMDDESEAKDDDNNEQS